MEEENLNMKFNTTNETQSAILLFLVQCHKNGWLVKGATKEAMMQFNVSGETKRHIWSGWKQKLDHWGWGDWSNIPQHDR